MPGSTIVNFGPIVQVLVGGTLLVNAETATSLVSLQSLLVSGTVDLNG